MDEGARVAGQRARAIMISQATPFMTEIPGRSSGPGPVVDSGARRG